MPFTPPPASRQLGFHERLVAARSRWLGPALQAALEDVDPDVLARDLAKFAPAAARKVLARARIRDEYVFPTPTLLRAEPMLLGYYRLLMGRPQKSFYSASKDGFGMFKSMEERGVLSAKQAARLDELCTALGLALSDLVTQLSPAITQADVDELPLLTMGSQLQGGNNNLIGQQATEDVFTSILSILPPKIILSQTATEVVFRNPAGRRVWVTLASDPDVRIREENSNPPPENHYKLAIEIKGGTDNSNAHNRAGEAEKSHQKARKEGCPEFWTIIATKGVDMGKLRTESPTTNHFFNSAEVLAMSGDHWQSFVGRVKSIFGI